MKNLFYFLVLIPIIGLPQQLITENILFDGNNRQYIVYIPQIYSPSNPSPILMSFHGGDGYAQDFMSYEADFRSIADTAGFILVYPQALEDPNNENNSTSWIHKEPTNHNDIYFVDALLDELSFNYSVDSDRIYICGYSLGGMFSYELACNLNDRVAAFSSVAGAAFIGAFNNCNINHPTALLNIVGTNDDIHPYNDVNGWYYTVSEINSYWATVNNTDPNPTVIELPDLNISDGSQVERYSWENGDGCISVEELKIINGGHDWPSPLSSWANQDINANTEIWNFVSKYNINGLIDCNSNIYGCTDQLAINFNSEANLDDQSCIYINDSNCDNIYITLSQGWNMIGFSCLENTNALNVFAAIQDKIIIAKDGAGNAYLPDWDFNGIGDLERGYGYLIKVSEEIINYNICE